MSKRSVYLQNNGDIATNRTNKFWSQDMSSKFNLSPNLSDYCFQAIIMGNSSTGQITARTSTTFAVNNNAEPIVFITEMVQQMTIFILLNFGTSR